MITYKGFNEDLTCRGYKYEVGKEYEMDGNIKVCERGFHACESPLEVFDHYDMLKSRFCKVEQSGMIDREKDSTKVCSSKIKVVAELKLADMIKLGVEWLIEKTKPSANISTDKHNDNGGYSAQIGSSGDYAKISSSGKIAQIDSTGFNSVICCVGHGSVVKAKVGSWITLSEWEYNESVSKKPICVKTEYVDGERIKADTWYRLVNGEFVEIF